MSSPAPRSELAAGDPVGVRRGRAVRGLPARDRAFVIGVLNVTPDSFSDGGRYLDAAAAIEHGLRLAAQGADLVDVGGESTRPGASRIDPDVEIARVVPVITELARQGVAVSVDTTRTAVAGPALDAGARMVNDVSGGAGDARMYDLVARLGVPYVLMHSRGASLDMAARASYDDVVREVGAELGCRLAAAHEAGVEDDLIVLDPGIGFHKGADDNWALLRGLPALHALGRPLLVGTSRKSFLGRLLADDTGSPRPAAERDAATCATTALAVAAGAWGVRVHDVPANLDAVRVAASWQAGPAASW